jgi:AcrR family transcriptional regulator
MLETMSVYVAASPRERPTPLERSLDDEQPPRTTPLDALRVAREAWMAGRPLDMGRLAGELGTSRATLYRWVGSKERLLGEVIWSLAEAEMQEARAAAAGSGADYVAEVTERYMAGATRFAPLRRFIEQDPEYALKVLASKHSPMQRRSIAATRDLLEEQVLAGALAPPLDLDSLAYLVVRIVESFLYSDVITGSEPDVTKAADAIHALLRAPPARRRSSLRTTPATRPAARSARSSS